MQKEGRGARPHARAQTQTASTRARACMTLPNAFLRPSLAHWSHASPIGVAGVMG